MPDGVDLVVIGAGPAGSACALRAARLGLAVALVDPRVDATDAPCGEGIMPSGVDVLRDLDLGGLVASGRPFPGVRHVVDGAAPLTIDLPRPGVAIARPDLLAALDAAVAAAPTVLRVRARGVATAGAGGFTVALGDGGSVAASTLVAADGAGGNAVAGPRPSVPRRAPGRFGLRARFRERAPLDRVEVHMGGGCEVYLTPLPHGLVNAAVLFERTPDGRLGPAALLDLAFERHPAARARCGALVTAPTGRALVRRRRGPASRAGAFFAGDAAGAVDPIVGCGVAIALATGDAAARAAAAVLRGADVAAVDRAYARAVRRERLARHALATLLRGGDAHPRWARAFVATLHRLPRATRALARIAGGR